MKKYLVLSTGLMLVAGVGIGLQSFYSKTATPTNSRSPASFETPATSTNAQSSIPEARPSYHIHHFSATGPHGYNPGQIRRAYGIDLSLGNGAGQTIAIIDAFGATNVQNDLNIFSHTFGLPSTKIEIYHPQGTQETTDETWALETALDIEWAHAVAPGAKLMLVVAKTATYPDLLGAVDFAISKGATQISMSWGSGEFSSETSLDFHFNNNNLSFFASAGDNGTGILWPAASPHVTAVGGTSLYLDAAGNLVKPEAAWAGSGGGESVYETEPHFQTHLQATGHRGVPDVSYNADPATGFSVYDSQGINGQTGWIQVGGTSAGAPQWAALMAVANSQRSYPLPALNSALYKLGASRNHSQYFRDIATGCNGPNSSITCAKKGYDFVTGLGSPLAHSLFKALDANAKKTSFRPSDPDDAKEDKGEEAGHNKREDVGNDKKQDFKEAKR